MLTSQGFEPSMAGVEMIQIHIQSIYMIKEEDYFICYLDRLNDFGKRSVSSSNLKNSIMGFEILEALVSCCDQRALERRVSILNFMRSVLDEEPRFLDETYTRALTSTLGKLASSTQLKIEVDLIESHHLHLMTKWLNVEKFKALRSCAILVLLKIRLCIPRLILKKSDFVCQGSFNLLADKALNIREKAAKLLSSVLVLLQDCDVVGFDRQHRRAITLITATVLQPMVSTEHLHGALVLLREMIDSAIDTAAKPSINHVTLPSISEGSGFTCFRGRSTHDHLIKALCGENCANSRIVAVRHAAFEVLTKLAKCEQMSLPLLDLIEFSRPSLCNEHDSKLCYRGLHTLLSCTTSALFESNYGVAVLRRYFDIIASAYEKRCSSGFEEATSILTEVIRICASQSKTKTQCTSTDISALRLIMFRVRYLLKSIFKANPSMTMFQFVCVATSCLPDLSKTVNVLFFGCLVRCLSSPYSPSDIWFISMGNQRRYRRPYKNLYIEDATTLRTRDDMSPNKNKSVSKFEETKSTASYLRNEFIDCYCLNGAKRGSICQYDSHPETSDCFSSYAPTMFDTDEARLVAMKLISELPCSFTDFQAVAFILRCCEVLLDYINHSNFKLRTEGSRAISHLLRSLWPLHRQPLCCRSQYSAICGLLGRAAAEMSRLRCIILDIVPARSLGRLNVFNYILQTWKDFAIFPSYQVQRAMASLLIRLLRFSPALFLPKFAQLLSVWIGKLRNVLNCSDEPNSKNVEEILWFIFNMLQIGEAYLQAALAILSPLFMPLYLADVVQSNSNNAVALVSILGALALDTEKFPDSVHVLEIVRCLTSRWLLEVSYQRALLILGLLKISLATGDVALSWNIDACKMLPVLLQMMCCEVGQQHIIAFVAFGALVRLSSHAFVYRSSSSDPTAPSVRRSEDGKRYSCLFQCSSSCFSLKDEIHYVMLGTLLRQLFYEPRLRQEALSTLMVVCGDLSLTPLSKRIAFETCIHMITFDLITIVKWQIPLDIVSRSQSQSRLGCKVSPNRHSPEPKCRRNHFDAKTWSKVRSTICCMNSFLEDAPAKALNDILAQMSFKMIMSQVSQNFKAIGERAQRCCLIESNKPRRDTVDVFAALLETIQILSRRVSLHVLTTQVDWLVPEILAHISTSSLHTLRFLDTIALPLVLTGNIRGAFRRMLSSVKGSFIKYTPTHRGSVRSVRQTLRDEIFMETRYILSVGLNLFSKIKQKELSSQLISLIHSLIDLSLKRSCCLFPSVNRPAFDTTGIGMKKPASNFDSTFAPLEQKSPEAASLAYPLRSDATVLLSELILHGAVLMLESLIKSDSTSLLSSFKTNLIVWSNLFQRACFLEMPAVEESISKDPSVIDDSNIGPPSQTAYSRYHHFIATTMRGECLPACTSRLPSEMKHEHMTCTNSKEETKLQDCEGRTHNFNQRDPDLIHISLESFDNAKRSDYGQMWNTRSIKSRFDWCQWIRLNSIEILRQSPSLYLRACTDVAETYRPLAYLLLKPAFLAWWIGHGLSLPKSSRRIFKFQFTTSLYKSLSSTDTPRHVQALLLSTLEYMFVHDMPLELDVSIISQNAGLCLNFSIFKFFVAETYEPNSARAAARSNINVDIIMWSTHTYSTPYSVEIAQVPNRQVIIKRRCKSKWKYCARTYYSPTKLYSDSRSLRISLASLKIASRRIELNIGWIENGVRQLKFILQAFDFKMAMRCSVAIWNYWATNLTSAQTRCEAKNPSGILNVANKSNQSSLMGQLVVIGAKASWALARWSDLRLFLSVKNLWIGRDLAKVSKDHYNMHALLSPYHFFFLTAVLALQDETPESFDEGPSHCARHLSQAREHVCTARAYLVQVWESLLSTRCCNVLQILQKSQQLTELDEVIQYRSKILRLSFRPLRPSIRDRSAGNLKSRLRLKWNRRLFSLVGRDATNMLEILFVRRLVFSVAEDLDLYLDIVRICHEDGFIVGAMNVLALVKQSHCIVTSLPDSTLMQTIPSLNSPPHENYFVLWYLRLLWAKTNQCRAASVLSYVMTNRLSALQSEQLNKNEISSNQSVDFILIATLVLICWRSHFVASCHGSIKIHCQKLCLEAICKITEISPHRQRTWQAWALMNDDVCRHHNMAPSMETFLDSHSSFVARAKDNLFSVRAAAESVRGFTNSLNIGNAESCKAQRLVSILAIIRLVSLWFRFGCSYEVDYEMKRAVAQIAMYQWLAVIPQIMSRVGHRISRVRSLLSALVVRIACFYPRVVVCPLVINSMLPFKSQRIASAYILNTLSFSFLHRNASAFDDVHLAMFSISGKKVVLDFNKAIAEARLLVNQLIRISYDWHEKFFSLIESAANSLYGDGNVSIMWAYLTDMSSEWYNEVESTSLFSHPEKVFHNFAKYENVCSGTIRFKAFYHVSNLEIHTVEKCMCKFILSRKTIDLNQVWRFYSTIHRTLKCSFNTLGKYLDISHVAPSLLELTFTELLVPGTFDFYSRMYPLVSIAAFDSNVQVMKSKQRPRRLEVCGSDGKKYAFLLKYQENMRQDEYVMQIFVLINLLVRKKEMRSHQGLKLRLYTVLPLSHITGLLGWVYKCSTMYEIISRYRARVAVAFDAELIKLNHSAPEYEALPHYTSEDIFTNVLIRSRSRDLHKMLLLMSRCIEMWLRSTLTFTQSLSMVSLSGYFLGVGDRHLSNMLVDRVSGQIVHIDFSDCFDEAASRLLYPERVPFRLTQQLVRASGLRGIDGAYGKHASFSLRTLRRNGLSILAMLETFLSEILVASKSLQLCSLSIKVNHRDRAIESRQTSERPCLESLYALIVDQTQQKVGGVDILGVKLTEEEQLGLLVSEARSSASLSGMFPGWCPLL